MYILTYIQLLLLVGFILMLLVLFYWLTSNQSDSSAMNGFGATLSTEVGVIIF